MKTLLWSLFAPVALLQALDLWTTVRALSKGAREANPIMAWLMRHLGVVPALVLVKTLFLGFLAFCIVVGPSTMLTLIMFAIVVGYISVVIHNEKLRRS